MRTLSARERRLLAILLLVLGLSLAWVAIIWPYVSGFSEREARRAVLLNEYQANQRLIASVGRLTRQAERQRDILRTYALSARTPAEAGAMLEARLQDAVEQTGGEIGSTELVEGGGDEVRARATARLAYPALLQLLASIENQPPYFAVERLAVAADQAVVSGKLEPVEVTVEVSAPYLRAAAR